MSDSGGADVDEDVGVAMAWSCHCLSYWGCSAVFSGLLTLACVASHQEHFIWWSFNFGGYSSRTVKGTSLDAGYGV